MLLDYLMFVVLSQSVVNKDFYPYYSWYTSEIQKHCRDQTMIPKTVSIDYGYTGIDKIATCQILPDRFKITVDRTFWDRESPNERLETMVHEFRHCFFRVGHVDLPGYYMNSVLQSISVQEVLEQAESDIELSCSSVKD